MKENELKQKKKKTIIIILIINIIIILFFVIKINYKNIISGNTITSKSSDSIVSNILNMKSYEANITAKIISNKNENTYEITQENIGEEAYKQIIKQPREIEGMEIIFKENKLEIKNAKLNLAKIYDNYKYIAENELILTSFIKNYEEENEKKIEENENEIIIEIKIKNEANKYVKYKTLYIDKKTEKPVKMEIKDISQKVLVYILYNEIKINALQEIV